MVREMFPKIPTSLNVNTFEDIKKSLPKLSTEELDKLRTLALIEKSKRTSRG